VTLRARLVALALVLALAVAAVLLALVRSQSPGCAVSAPRPSLPDQLRALGEFDQSYDPANPVALGDAAQRAAAALHPDLIGAVAETPVAVSAMSALSPAALVVPLRSAAPAAVGVRPLAGLVVFLRDCQGNAYFAAVEDDLSRQPPLAAFPAVDRDRAVAQLGTTAIGLAYARDPLQPEWLTTTAPSRSLPAR
jgi:hypothetical protein